MRYRRIHRCACPNDCAAWRPVIDGTGSAAIDNATIVIRDGRIVAIGPSAATPIPGDAEVVDYAGKTIIPGLISAHSHVGIFVGLKAAPENYNRDAILRQLKQLEAYGVTTVMALGLEWAAVLRTASGASRSQASGCRPLWCRSGHWRRGRSAIRGGCSGWRGPDLATRHRREGT